MHFSKKSRVRSEWYGYTKVRMNEMTPKVEAVQKMQDYIAAHQNEEINLKALSDAACYSPWYCYRIFKELTGLTVSGYVRRLKLTGAARRLKNSDAKVIDVALDSGFESVDGFQRAFYREFGCNPGTYATHPVPVPYFLPYGVKFTRKQSTDTSHNDAPHQGDIMETKNIFIQLIKKPARKVIIKRGEKATEYFAYCEEVGCDVWGILTSMDNSLAGEPVCLWLPEKLRAGKSEYVQGVEVQPDYKGAIPDGFDVIDLPACDYLMFQGEPFKEEDFEEAIGAMWEAEKKYDPSVIGYNWDKENPRYQLEPRGDRGYIELLAVKAK